jgi:uncharacterized protein YlxP (DUF503 family)
VKQQSRNRYNCSVAETDFHERHARARLTVCVVSDESTHANTQLNEIAHFSLMKVGAEVIDYRIEML